MRHDARQDLVDYSYTIANGRRLANGRRKVVAYRPLHSSDPADYALTDTSKVFYALVVVGDTLDVAWNTNSEAQTMVCATSLTQKGDCKTTAAWADTPPTLEMLTSYAPPSTHRLSLLASVSIAVASVLGYL